MSVLTKVGYGIVGGGVALVLVGISQFVPDFLYGLGLAGIYFVAFMASFFVPSILFVIVGTRIITKNDSSPRLSLLTATFLAGLGVIINTGFIYRGDDALFLKLFVAAEVVVAACAMYGFLRLRKLKGEVGDPADGFAKTGTDSFIVIALLMIFALLRLFYLIAG